MKIKLEACRHCGVGAFLPIPDMVLEQLGWDVGDEIMVDIGFTEDTLILKKVGDNHTVRVVSTGATDKSREIQRVGEEVV